MKKASEYVKQYLDEGKTDLALAKVFQEMSVEVKELMVMRKGKTNSALASALNEIDQKWRSFASQVEVNPEGFMRLQKKYFPQAFDLWMNVRQSRGQPAYV